MTTNELLWFFCLLPVISFAYAAVGHGGASGYLALMSLFAFTPETMKPTALLLNLFVAGTSFYYFYKSGFFKPRLFFPFSIASVPLAFLGGMTSIDAQLYKKILAVLLIFAILRMLNVFGSGSDKFRSPKIWQALLIGGVIGYFSGLIGIGGGIILSPLILLLHWGNVKEAAAVSALFIWVNSLAGLIGQYSSGIQLSPLSVWMVLVAVVGGLAGSYWGSKKFSLQSVRYLLAFVLVIASFKLFFT